MIERFYPAVPPMELFDLLLPEPEPVPTDPIEPIHTNFMYYVNTVDERDRLEALQLEIIMQIDMEKVIERGAGQLRRESMRLEISEYDWEEGRER